MTLWWPQQGTDHCRDMLIRELGYLDREFRLFFGSHDEVQPTLEFGGFDGDAYTDYGWYETPFDSEHLVSVSLHIPMMSPDSGPAPEPIPEPAPAPEPVPDTGGQPTGATVEFVGTVTEVGSGYFSVDGHRVNIDTTSIIKFQERAGPISKLATRSRARVLSSPTIPCWP